MESSPSTDQALQSLLASLSPMLDPDEYVYAALPGESVGHFLWSSSTLCLVREKEGMCVVLTREAAELQGLEYTHRSALITLGVESALDSVGLTGAVSLCLADAGISCNVIAGLRHDHLLVPAAKGRKALAELKRLSRSASNRR